PPLVSTLDARIVWKASVGSAQGEALQPAATDDAIYAASASGALVRLDPRNGQEVWRADTQQRIASGVGTDGDTVVVATSRGQVLAYGADGQHRWTAQATSDVMSPALVGHGLVIVRATDQRISAFEIQTGQKRWVYQREQPPLTLRVVSDMRFIQNLLVVGFPQGRLVGIALADGSLLWEAPVAQPSGSTEVERLADVVGPMAVDQRDICAATFQGRIVCIDAERGALRWARPLSALAGVLIDGESVVAIDENSHVLAYARSTGASLWVNQQLHRRG
ncbi:MAG TPA: outer membrane protein assembly factor BamB, partial [Burkholderiaceae bacterium]|nr:outer membrane protein assembly factor BamB [Burkholderiaceae bacterium]